MAIQYSVEVRNAQLDAFESTTGAAPKLRIYSGSAPANTAAAATGTMLCEITLPSDWMNAASSGSKTLLGTWSGTGDAAAGTGTTAGYFRIWNSGATTCHLQGTAGASGDLVLNNASIASGQAVSVTQFTLTRGNA